MWSTRARCLRQPSHTDRAGHQKTGRTASCRRGLLRALPARLRRTRPRGRRSHIRSAYFGKRARGNHHYIHRYDHRVFQYRGHLVRKQYFRRLGLAEKVQIAKFDPENPKPAGAL